MPIEGPKNGLIDEFIERLENLSSELNKTLVITSGRREGDVNASAHNSGIAADCYASGMDSAELATEMVNAGFTGVGEYWRNDDDLERFAHADIRGLPGSEDSGAYAPGGRKGNPLCWYRVGEDCTFGSRKSGGLCPTPFTLPDLGLPLPVDNVDVSAGDADRVATMRNLISAVVEDLDTGDLDNKKRFMLHVAWHEGAFLKERVQRGGGPGRSFFQMEPPRSWDAYEWADQRRWIDRLTESSGLTASVLRAAALDLPRTAGLPWPSGNKIEAKLKEIDLFGVYMARIVLKRISNAIGPTNQDHAVYWADHWKIQFDPDTPRERDRLIAVFKQEADQVDDL